MKDIFGIGSIAVPKKNTGHGSFQLQDVGKKFTVIKINSCEKDPDCPGCPGNPVVELRGELVELCGWGEPSRNFDFTQGDWDE